MSYNKSKLAKYLQLLIENTTDDSSSFDSSEPHSVLGGAGSAFEIVGEDGRRMVGQVGEDAPPTLYIKQDGLAAKNDFANECLKSREFATQIGTDALFKRLDELIKEIVPKGESEIDFADIVKKDILKKLRADVKTWKVRAPITNLKIANEIQIGAVTFLPHNYGIVENTKMVMNHNGAEDKDKNISDKAAILKVLGSFAAQGSAWALTEVDAHAERINHVAGEKIETSINVVRCFTHVFHSHSLSAAFGLPYELIGGQTGYIAESDFGMNIQWDRRGMYAPFEINDSVIKHLEENCCLGDLSRIAATKWEDLNTLESALRVAIQWLGRSVIALTNADAFTLCAITIERILICDGEETTVEKFADRLAYLISDVGDDRKRIHRMAKRLYGVRSKIVHAGFEAVEKQQLQEMEHLALSALVATAKQLGELDSHEKLKSLLHDRKLS